MSSGHHLRLCRSPRFIYFLLLFVLSTALGGYTIAHASAEQLSRSEGWTSATPLRATSTPAPTLSPVPAAASDLASSLASIPAPRPASSQLDVSHLPSPPGLVPERILIPRVGIDAKIVRLDTKIDERGDAVWETAAFAVGQHRGSANPGERGNIILSGHISSVHEGAVFKRLTEVVAGDGMVLMTAERDYLYRIVKTAVVTPDHLEAMEQTPDETVTLLTCVPDGVYTHRLVVTAKRVSPSLR